jgi:sugar lactone lactonase YvrE
VIRRITPDGTVTTIAGAVGIAGSQDGPSSNARLNHPYGIAVGADGALYVADTYNHTVRSIANGTVTTVAGLAGTSGTVDGTGANARFTFPSGIDVDPSGNIFVADTNNHTIRKITPGRVVTTVAGVSRLPGSSDGFGSQARFNYPFDVAVGAGGFLYVADTYNHSIRKISPDGQVTTMAGIPQNDSKGSPGSKDGTGTDARFNFPWGIDVDDAGNVFVADTANQLIRKITPGLVVTTIAGGAGVFGNTDAVGTAARFHAPSGIAVQADGTLFIADRYNHTIRVISPALAVRTLAGSPPRWATTNAKGTSARFFFPEGITFDSAGNLYVAEGSHAIRKITPDGTVTTFAGLPGTAGSSDGNVFSARFRNPYGVAADSLGNIYVADTDNHIIRKISSGTVTTVAGAAGVAGDVTGAGSQARFDSPFSVAADQLGNLYVADTYNHRIKQIDPAGVVSNFAGSGSEGSQNGIGTSASFRYPTGIALDASRNIYVADWGNHTIRKITQAGQVSTVAGLAGTSGSADGTASAARFDNPFGIAARADGTLFVTDEENHTLRRVSPAGVVVTVAGLAESPGNVDGVGALARFFFPDGVAVDSSGQVAIADTYNHAIRLGALAPPVIVSFTAAPQLLSKAGNVTFSWSTTNASSATIDNGIGTVPVNGSRTITVASTSRYTLTVTGEGGTATATVTVTIGATKRRSARH